MTRGIFAQSAIIDVQHELLAWSCLQGLNLAERRRGMKMVEGEILYGAPCAGKPLALRLISSTAPVADYGPTTT
ncbi:hypothetical protein DYH09_15290 [bacterium CPR1]|nr:hypothetical protein [bacterium CPR1]